MWQRTGQDEEPLRELLLQAHRVAHGLHTLGPLIGELPWRKRDPRRAPPLSVPSPA
ncbi:hypothetical protein KYC5002_02135 [Archangium violaceum]|uniref:hypothetical protein n=1 Tax=Archangium violaceum TaxID=83451 RepID=UPI002B28451D|nr:hypothetical protein KYC5002_02135 [Archangium gephyra]